MPNFINNSLRLPHNIRHSLSLHRFTERTKMRLLAHLIRSKSADIVFTKTAIRDENDRLPDNVRSKLTPILDETRTTSKKIIKTRLIAQFDRLRNAQKRPEPMVASASANSRVSILDDINVPQTAINALAKGPKFVLSSKFNREDLQHTVQVETAALAYAMRWHSTVNRTTHSNIDHTADINKACPFHNRRKEPPRDHRDVEKAIQALQMDLQQLVDRSELETKPNISKEERKAIAQIRNDPDTTITRSDKGGELVVMKTSNLQKLCLEHLADTSTYQKLKRDSTSEIRVRVNKALDRILTSREFPPSLIAKLQTPSTARTQQFYALPKTHKVTLKIRPIISACGGIFDRLGWLLQHVLKPILKQIPAHLSNTADLLERFRTTPEDELRSKLPVSFDVISLYTNINAEEAIETTLEYIRSSKLYLYGLHTEDIYELLHLLLDNNVFAYEGHFYKQTRGLAMGNRLSGTLAIICMDRFEQRHIYELHPRPTIYVRYVDDIGTVVENTDAAERMLTYLNSKHPTIKFEMELPDPDLFLPILDVKIQITETGAIQYKLFRKKTNKGIMLNFGSHHPSTVKMAAARNELQRAIRCSTAEHRDDAISATVDRLRQNGYPENWITSAKDIPKRRKTALQPIHSLKIPFVSDAFNFQVRQLLRKHNIPARLVNRRGFTLQQLAAGPRSQKIKTDCPRRKTCPAPDICQQSSLVYKATCQLCHNAYIGMTTRRLHVRAREHMNSAKQHSPDSTFGEHYREKHPQEIPSIKFEILKRCSDDLRLHIEEALAIQQFRPSLNRRVEDMGTGFLI